jgi:hypothetical protein
MDPSISHNTNRIISSVFDSILCITYLSPVNLQLITESGHRHQLGRMNPEPAKMDIPNPRRILAVALADSAQHLSDVIKGMPIKLTSSPLHPVYHPLLPPNRKPGTLIDEPTNQPP